MTQRPRPDEVWTPLHPEAIDPGGIAPGGDSPCRPGVELGVLEPRRGYRFGPENLLLPWLLRGEAAERIAELGAGNGSLLVLAWYALDARAAVGIERQPEVAERLDRTLRAHALDAAHAVAGDLRDAACLDAARELLGGAPDLVLANPPFFPAGWGQPSRNPQTRASTHAEHGDVGDFLRATAALLAPCGRAWFVYDAARLTELLAAAAAAGLGATRLHWCADARPDREHEPYRVWVELRAGAGLRVDGPARCAGQAPRPDPTPA